MWLGKNAQHSQAVLFQTPACAVVCWLTFSLGPLWVSQTCFSLAPCLGLLGLEGDLAAADTLHRLEVLGTVDQSALVVLARVDKVLKVS